MSNLDYPELPPASTRPHNWYYALHNIAGQEDLGDLSATEAAQVLSPYWHEADEHGLMGYEQADYAIEQARQQLSQPPLYNRGASSGVGGYRHEPMTHSPNRNLYNRGMNGGCGLMPSQPQITQDLYNRGMNGGCGCSAKKSQSPRMSPRLSGPRPMPSQITQDLYNRGMNGGCGCSAKKYQSQPPAFYQPPLPKSPRLSPRMSLQNDELYRRGMKSGCGCGSKTR